jgi:5-formyltetrahydrofolate cyclo-ligase
MQAASPPPSDKNSWRQWFRERLRKAPNPAAESEEIRHHLIDEFSSCSGLRIASFAALRGETDLGLLVNELPGIEWGFPRVVGPDLSFHQVHDLSELRTGTMSILEPPSELPQIDPRTFDVILCPGLGFGLDGSRIGRGRGYYDRTLEACRKDTRIIGVALSHQIVEALPVEAHDQFMDQLVTARGFIEPSKS